MSYLAQNLTNMPYDEQVSIAETGSKDDRLILALSPYTDQKVLGLVLSLDSDLDVRHAVAHNPHTSWEILEGMLMHDNNPSVGEAVGQNPNLLGISISEVVAVRESIFLSRVAWMMLLQHPNCSYEDWTVLHREIFG